jgi:hypothetical protein
MESHPQSSAPKSSEVTARLGGLCVNCEYQESCAFRKTTNEPTLFCEEFTVSATPMNPLPSQEPVMVSEAKKVAIYTGLCINCDHRETCVFIEAGAGGWHCEEYA